MTRKRESAVEVDRDGVRTVRDPRIRWVLRLAVLASVAVVVLTAAALLMQARTRPVSEETMPAPLVREAPERPAKPALAHRAPTLRAVRSAPKQAPSAADVESFARADEAPREDQPEVDAKEIIEALVASGEREGIAAFPPPGTEPLKRGIVVPEDFELPEGYVRHYQATDEGERVAAILMFSPDYDFYDETGAPIVVPEDGVVPPHLAPPGMPVRMLELPGRKGSAGR